MSEEKKEVLGNNEVKDSELFLMHYSILASTIFAKEPENVDVLNEISQKVSEDDEVVKMLYDFSALLNAKMKEYGSEIQPVFSSLVPRFFAPVDKKENIEIIESFLKYVNEQVDEENKK